MAVGCCRDNGVRAFVNRVPTTSYLFRPRVYTVSEGWAEVWGEWGEGRGGVGVGRRSDVGLSGCAVGVV